MGENEAGNVGGEKSPWAEGKNDSLGGSSFGAEIHEFHELEKFGSGRLEAFPKRVFFETINKVKLYL